MGTGFFTGQMTQPTVSKAQSTEGTHKSKPKNTIMHPNQGTQITQITHTHTQTNKKTN